MTRRTIIGILFVVAALWKLASMWNIFHVDWLWKQPWTEYIGPALLLYVGVHLIINGFSREHDQWLQRPIPIDENGKRIYCSARFGGDEYIYNGESFKGARLDVFCGGIRLDLRNAIINEDEVIDIRTFLGGVEVLVPKNVNVVVNSRSFIGWVNNETKQRTVTGAPWLHIVASNFFGGVKINNELS